jgi:hypothetical protein
MVTVELGDPSKRPAADQRRIGQRFWRRLSVKTLLVLALGIFMGAVAVDSFHQAIAADLPPLPMGMGLQAQAAQPVDQNRHRPGEALDSSVELYLDAQTAQRLHQSDLTSAIMTRSRLTSAHLFAAN